MNATLLIARRELGAYLRSMTGYIIAAALLLVEGLLFNSWGISGEKLSADVLANYFLLAFGVTVIASIFISMRLFAEERQTGTLVLLTSSPVHDRQLVLGKYLAALAFMALVTLVSVYIPALIFVNGKVSIGHMVAGYLGVILAGGAALAVGTLGSALARTQVLAAIISGAMVLALVICHFVAQVTENPFKDAIMALALFARHFPGFQSGTVNLRDVAYYVLLTYVALFAATRVLEARRWR